jgi:hypothetical protein
VDPDPHESALIFCRMDLDLFPGGEKVTNRKGKSEEI